MKFVVVSLLVAALATAGAMESQGIDDIPHDKCGVITFVNDAAEVELYALGEDRSLLHKRQLCTGGWTKWTSMGGVFSSGPKVIMNWNHEAEIFILGADKTLWHKKASNRNSTQFTAFATMGGHFSTAPTAVTDSEGLIHVFVRGIDRALWHKMQKRLPDGTLGWHDWVSLGGTLTSTPEALLDPEGLIHVFARGMNRALLHKHTVINETYHITWSPWESLGGNLASAPRSVALDNSVNFVEIFARAADKGLWRKRQTLDPDNLDEPVKWSVWEALGGIFSSGPASIVNSNGNIDIFARGTDKAIWHKQQILTNDEGTEDWTAWESLGGIVSTTPAVAKEEEGLVHVFTRGVDRAIWAKYQVRGANSTISWTPWYSLGARTLKFNC